MTESDRDGVDDADEVAAPDLAQSASLKDGEGAADDKDVLDGISGRPRLTWDSVTDAGGAPAEVGERQEKSSFQFDLGGALARLGSDEPATDEPRTEVLETEVPETPLESVGRTHDVEAPEPIADRVAATERARVDEPVAPADPEQAPGPLEAERVASEQPAAVSDARSVELDPSPSRVDQVVAPDPLPSPVDRVVAPDPLPSRVDRVAPDPLLSRVDEPVVAPDALPSRVDRVVAPDPLPSRVDEPVAAPDALPSRADRVVEPDPLPTWNTAVANEAESAPDVIADASTQYPRRVPGTHLESQMRDAEHDVPAIVEATPADAAPRVATRQSVFDDTVAGAATVPGAPTLPGGPNPAAGAVPSLPASNPVAPPPVVESVGAGPTTPDINALRSAQLRANKQQRRGKLFGRSLLAFVLIGGIIAAGLVFGRSLLFDTSWDAQLTPIVNEVEAARGAEFDETVTLEVVPAEEFGEILRAAAIGDAWVDRVPEWRALGLATGPVSAESVGAALASSTKAIYDPTGNMIYLVDGGDPADAAPDLRVALERAFDAQNGVTFDADLRESGTGTGFAGVSSLDSIATRAVDEVIASGGTVDARRPADESLPFPIAYEFAAVDVLGEPILASAGLTAADVPVGGPYPEAVLTALDDAPGTATSVLIQPGEVALAPPAALGKDDWSLVWGARLPETTVDRLVEQVDADSYRPVDRSGTVCVVAVFQTSTEEAGTEVFTSMLSWAANAPAASQAVISQLSPTRVQLDVCDPGAEGGTPPNIGVVDALIDRQQLRLTN